MSQISETLLISEYSRWKDYFNLFDEGLGVDFGNMMNTKYAFNDKKLKKCTDSAEAYKIIKQKHVKT